MFELSNGLQIDPSVVQGIDLSIRTNTNPPVIGSVLMELSGPVSRTQLEGGAPYALFGDSAGGNYNGVPFPEGSYTITATGFDGRYGAGNVIGVTSVQFSIAPGEEELPALLRLNSGGGTISYGDVIFESDRFFAGNGKAYANNNVEEVFETDRDAIYKTERSTNGNLESFSYKIPVTNGQYELVLHFAEIFWGATGGGDGGEGKRVFSVFIEGEEVLTDFDMNQEKSPMTAFVRRFDTEVSDNEINIEFSATVNQPKVSAVEVYGLGELLDIPGECEWNNLADSGLSRVEAQSVKLNGKLYVLAGFLSGLKVTAATEIYDPITNSWSIGAPMPTPVTHMGAVGVGDEIWIVTGFVGNHPGVATDKVQIYNTLTDSWSEGPPLPNPRGSGAAVYSNGKIHFFGGLLPDRVTDVGEHYILDVINRDAGWQQAATMPNPRNHLSAAAVGGKIYAIGGQYGHDNGVQDQSFLDEYDPSTDSWTRKANLPSARSHFEPGTMVHNDKIIIVGGRRGGFFFDDVTQYDPLSNTWTELCELPSNLLAPAAKVFGDQLIVANGGENGTCCPKSSTISIQLEPEVKIDNPIDVLVYHETNEFRHGSIGAGIEMINDLGNILGWTVMDSMESNVFNDVDLSNYEVVIWLNTSGNGLLTAEEQSAFEAYIRNGGGFVGIHAATDTYRDRSWLWYNDLVGGVVQSMPNHTPNNTNATMDVVGTHPAVSHLGTEWNKDEEYYYWDINGGYLYSGNINLLNVRETGSESYDANRPVTWYKNYDGGRSFYTALGHNDSDYSSNAKFRKMIAEAILWAADSEATAPALMSRLPNIPDNTTEQPLIYPNPVGSSLFVQTSNFSGTGPISISLYGLDGKLITQKSVNSSNNQIAMEGVRSGYYVATLNQGNITRRQLIYVK